MLTKKLFINGPFPVLSLLTLVVTATMYWCCLLMNLKSKADPLKSAATVRWGGALYNVTTVLCSTRLSSKLGHDQDLDRLIY